MLRLLLLLLLLLIFTLRCNADPVDRLCCVSGALGDSIGVPQINPDGSGCPVDPYASETAYLVFPNDSYIEGTCF